MLGYLSKFVLQMLPTISATVIGAYIVSTWINPKTPPEPAKVAAHAQGKEAVKAPPAAEPRAAEVTPPPEAKSAETAKPVQAATGPENIRIVPIVKDKAPATDAPVAAPAAAAETTAVIDERKDANELARAAIQRLRGGAEPLRAADEGGKPAASSLRGQQARAVPEPAQPATSVTAVPPLPPAVSIAAPRYPQDEAADQPTPGQSDRVAPPAEIPPARNPLSLQASHQVAENPSFADDFVSATKSFFRAITPR